MAGMDNARVELGWDKHSWTVQPEHCPALNGDELEKLGGEQPVCYREHPDGSRRACIHWIATVRVRNANERVDAAYLLGGIKGDRDLSTAQCGTLCQAMRRNRPPGC